MWLLHCDFPLKSTTVEIEEKSKYLFCNHHMLSTNSHLMLTIIGTDDKNACF